MTIQELADLKEFGIIVLGAGGNIDDWKNGIETILKSEEIVNKEVSTFSSAELITGNIKGEDGRRDLLLIFNPESKPNIGKLALWRIRVGSISWTDDFIDNYGKDYGLPAREDKYNDVEED